MSVVIAAKYKDGVAMIADKQATEWNNKTDNVTKMAYYKYSNTGIGVVGYLRDCNLMRLLDEVVPYKDILDNVEIDELYVMRTIVPSIMKHLAANKRLDEKDNNMDSKMIFATPDKIFEIGSDFSVIETDGDFLAVGCGNDKALGYMTSIGETKKFSREAITDILLAAVREGCAKDVYINDHCDILYLENNG